MNERRREIIDAAKDYAKRGWSVIPIGSDKKPLGKWKGRQTIRATPDEIEREFNKPELRGVGIVLGEVSGCLYVRDFDKRESYELWKASHPDLASTIPTVQTGRGYHIYLRLRGTGCDTKVCHGRGGERDGEFRGSGGYVVAPPSIHPSGAVYEWIVPLGDEVPLVSDVKAAGLYATAPEHRREWLGGAGTDATDDTDVTHATHATYGIDDIRSEPKTANTSIRSEHEGVEELIHRFPPGPGTHDEALWNLVRHLKAIPSLRPAAKDRLKEVARRWWEVHRQRINNNPQFAYTWGKVADMWDRAATAAGETLAGAVSESDSLPIPACVADYADDEHTVRIAKLCVVLQGRKPREPFLLSFRALAEATGIPMATAHATMRALVADGSLRCVEIGTRRGRGGRGKGSTWRWLG